MKSSTDLQERRYPAAQPNGSLRRLDDAAEDLEQRRLASPIAANDADDLPALDFEADIVQCPERLVLRLLLARWVLSSDSFCTLNVSAIVSFNERHRATANTKGVTGTQSVAFTNVITD